jgi:GntR family transcriptional regulator/MocR family aminotransferase
MSKIQDLSFRLVHDSIHAMTKNPTGIISPLDPKAAETFYRQIYDRVLGAIVSGVLKPGDRIPSARALMAELGLARGTVESAYALLAAEGYIQARGQAGTVVTPGLQPRALVEPAPPRSKARSAKPSFRPETTLPFQMGLPALDAFPRKIWARLGRGACAPCSLATWRFLRFMAFFRCVPALRPICMLRAA